MNRYMVVAANGAGVHPVDLGLVDVPVTESLEGLFQGDSPLETRQRGADAEVGAVSEREVTVDLALDIESIGVIEVAVVAVATAVEEQHLRTARNHGAVDLDVVFHPAGLHR